MISVDHLIHMRHMSTSVYVQFVNLHGLLTALTCVRKTLTIQRGPDALLSHSARLPKWRPHRMQHSISSTAAFSKEM